MYDINNIKEETNVKGLETTQLLSKKNIRVSIEFDTIDCTVKDQELIDRLSIIRGDIYDVCQDVCDKCIVIRDWDDTMFEDCIELLQTYLNDKNIATSETPVFLVVGAMYNNNSQVRTKLTELGFSSADHLVDLDNNYVMVMTSLETHRKLMKNYVIRHMM